MKTDQLAVQRDQGDVTPASSAIVPDHGNDDLGKLRAVAVDVELPQRTLRNSNTANQSVSVFAQSTESLAQLPETSGEISVNGAKISTASFVSLDQSRAYFALQISGEAVASSALQRIGLASSSEAPQLMLQLGSVLIDDQVQLEAAFDRAVEFVNALSRSQVRWFEESGAMSAEAAAVLSRALKDFELGGIVSVLESQGSSIDPENFRGIVVVESEFCLGESRLAA